MSTQEQIPHGTHDGYVNHHCRCDDCKAGHRDYVRDWRHSTGHYSAVAQRRAQAEAARRYRTQYPAEWAQLLRDETERAKTERRAVR